MTARTAPPPRPGRKGPTARRGRSRAGSRAGDDSERLRHALGRRRVDPTRSLFGAESMTWKVNREAVTLVGGGRALLLQIAHPLVAAGVSEHSDFRSAPLERLRRTLESMLAITFADAASAIAAVRRIERVHDRVRGRLATTVGPFRRGTRYDADRPDLLLWVHSTLVDTSLLVYERFVEPLSPELREAYYEESKVAARLFAIPERLVPKTWREFRVYMDDMIGGPVLTVGTEGRAVAASILDPPLPVVVKQGFQTSNFFTAGLLPPPLRQRYGLAWGWRREKTLDLIAATVRASLPVLPARVRFYPRALAATAVGAEDGARRSARRSLPVAKPE